MSAEAGDPDGMVIRAEHTLHGTIAARHISVAFDLSKNALE